MMEMAGLISKWDQIYITRDKCNRLDGASSEPVMTQDIIYLFLYIVNTGLLLGFLVLVIEIIVAKCQYRRAKQIRGTSYTVSHLVINSQRWAGLRNGSIRSDQASTNNNDDIIHTRLEL